MRALIFHQRPRFVLTKPVGRKTKVGKHYPLAGQHPGPAAINTAQVITFGQIFGIDPAFTFDVDGVIGQR